MDYGQRFVVAPGSKLSLARIDPSFRGKQSHKKAEQLIANALERMDRVQYLLFADATQSLLVILSEIPRVHTLSVERLAIAAAATQFEREVTAERIRDKIAQSKARGMWMGGTPPVGYRPNGRSLAIIEEDAAIVRHIFNRYAELRNVRMLAMGLEDSGIRSPSRSASTGRVFGGGPFSRGHLYRILSNPIYIARIDHGGRSHEANHLAHLTVKRLCTPNAVSARWDRQFA